MTRAKYLIIRKSGTCRKDVAERARLTNSHMRVPTSRRFLVAALCLLLIAVSNVAGQSGRKTPPRTPAAPANDRAFVPDPNRDEYQLIFTKFSEAEKVEHTLDSWERREYHAASFSENLTRVGTQGYRLVSLALSPRLAVMRRADYQYEYSVLQISSRQGFFPNNPKFGFTYEPWARKGFRVADYFVIYDDCEFSTHDLMSGSFDLRLDCTYYSTAVLERRIVAKIPPAFDIVSGPLTLSKKKLEGELLEGLNNGPKSNLYPTHMLTKFQILRQSLYSVEDFPDADYEIEIVSGDVRKRVNVLAQQGYRLILRPIWFQAAIMHRKKGAIDAASYIWVDEKKLEQELPKLQEQGAIYRMNYGCQTGSSTLMIFELPSVRHGKKREYKLLAIELKELENGANAKAEFEMSSGSNSAVQELNRLSKDGFEVRDFVGCHMSNRKEGPSSAKILLERGNPS